MCKGSMGVAGRTRGRAWQLAHGNGAGGLSEGEGTGRERGGA